MASKMNKQIIFISIDGLTDPLGQSQILPYLTGLAQIGYRVTIVSCEKDHNFVKNKETIVSILKAADIKWIYCFYNDKIPLLSQWLNFKKLKQLAVKTVKYGDTDSIIHCRSYLPAMIGLHLKQKYGTKFIFDMRGFWANERVDGQIWNLSNPIHKTLYNYFKRKEKILITEADYIVTLSQKGKTIVTDWLPDSSQKLIEVIPCCVDTNHFLISTPEEKSTLRKKVGIADDSFVAGYLGSIGTWYMLDEMLDFFIALKQKKKSAILFFVTQDNEKTIWEAAKKKNLDISSIRIVSSKRDEVPKYIATFNVALFFIKPLFSKQGSFPTKMAEVLACGIPVITNAGVGDCDEIINENKCGLLVNDFTKEEYNKAVENIDQLTQKSPETLRKVALDKFSLKDGVESYRKIYDYLFSTGK
jgi:glycosyltransferase involved in cell wall biosynthesis